MNCKPDVNHSQQVVPEGGFEPPTRGFSILAPTLKNNDNFVNRGENEPIEINGLEKQRKPEREMITVMSGGVVLYYVDPVTLKFIDPKIPPPPETPQTLPDLIADMQGIAAKRKSFGFCYFIGGEDGAIKIGTSVCVKDRFAAIQSCSPIKLSVLAVTNGGALVEGTYHYHFAKSRLHGEWFERTPELMAEIERLNSNTLILKGMEDGE
jgi:hypothetical protein